MNQTAYDIFKGTDLSHRSYFIEAKNRHSAYYSNAIDSNDGIARVYVSYPIITDVQTRQLSGIAVAGIKLMTLGKFLQQELPQDFQSTVGLVDKNGTYFIQKQRT